MELSRQGREYFYWPFWGDIILAAVQISAGPVWVDMTAVPTYVPDKPVDPDAQWFRALIAGPDVTANPDDTLVLTGSHAVRFRVQDTPEIVVRSGETLTLVA